MAKSPAIAELGSPAIDVLARVLERGRADGTFRRDVDAVDVHMMISAFCVFRVANRYTFGTLFDRDLADPALRDRYRTMLGDMVVGYLRAPRRVAATRHPGLRARTMAEPACSWTRWVSVISMSVRPASARWRAYSSRVSAPAMQPTYCGDVGARGGVHAGVGDDVRDGEAAAGLEDARGLAQDLGLVRREVDDAVGEHDVDGGGGERDRLDVALEPVDVRRRRPWPGWRVARASISSVMSRP